MTFLNPALLAAGLLAISIPIIIHLLMHRRRKPVVWGAMRFLLEAYRRQQRRLMLEKWLLLALRCLLVALIAIAIGRPLFGGGARSAGSSTLFILIDNSIASSARDADSGRPALERHKAQAKALLSALRDQPGDAHSAALIALGSPSEALISPPSSDLAAVESLLDGLEPTDSRADLPAAFTLVTSVFSRPDTASSSSPAGVLDPRACAVAVLSDFREGTLALGHSSSQRTARLPEGVRLGASAPASAPLMNVSITGVEPLRSLVIAGSKDAESELVRVTLSRSGAIDREAPPSRVRARFAPVASAAIATAPAGTAPDVSVRWERGQETAQAIVPLRMNVLDASPDCASGARTSGVVVASVADADAVDADNRFRRPLDVRESLRVGIVAPSRFAAAERADRMDPGAWVRLALSPGGATDSGGIDVVDIEPATIDAARLAGLDAAILPRPDLIPESAWARLRLFLDSGGLVLVMPPPGVNVHLWPDAMTTALTLDWTLPRETAASENASLARTRDAQAAAPSLLSLIDGELDDLLRPISVRRALPMRLDAQSGSRTASGRTLLTLGDAPLLWAGPPGPNEPAKSTTTESAATGARGLIVYLAVALDLDWTDLPAKPLMVPLIQEIVRQGVGQARGSFSLVAGERSVAPSRTLQLEPIADPAMDRAATRSTPDAPAGIRIDAAGMVPAIKSSGVYKALDETGAARTLVAINADELGARVATQPRAGIESWLLRAIESGAAAPGAPEAPARTIVWLSEGQAAPPALFRDTASQSERSRRASSDSSSLWWILLSGVLGVSLIELFVARWSSHARAGMSTGPAAPAPAAVDSLAAVLGAPTSGGQSA